MSKGEIVSHIADGKYRVRQKLAVEKIQEEITSLSDRIAELAISLPNAKVELIKAEDAAEDKIREINLAIPDFQAGVEGAADLIGKLQSELVRLQADVRLAEIKVSQLIAEKLSVLKRRGQLASVPEGRELELWCADHTLDLSGEVGIVDINDEGGRSAVIQPGYDGEAVYSPSRDGALFPNLAQSGPQIYLNAAILPGVQKWMPRYRVGEITKLQVDLCTVVLDPAQSSAQDLPINQNDTLADIPIVYMDCNGSAFKQGDRVLVRFTANGPLVIGFESDPVPCSLFGFVFEPAKYEAGPGPSYKALKTTYGEPFEDVGGQINSPLGTEDGPNNAWTAVPDAGSLDIQRGKARNYGNKNWFNNEKLVLSWHGPPGRAHRLDQIDTLFTGFLADWQTAPYVFHDLKIILDLSQESVAGAFVNVFGAAIHEDALDQRWLIVVASDKEFIPVDSRTTEGQSFKVFRVAIDAALQASGPLELLHQHTLPIEMTYQSHFYFSEDGEKAVCTLVGDVANTTGLHIDLLRYDISTGFSVDQIWSQDDSIGTRVIDQYYLQDTNPPDPAVAITRDGTYYSSHQAGSYVVPIYCDYVNNSEVIAYESWPSVDSVNQSQYSYIETNEDITTTASNSLIETHGGVFSVVTSNGDILFKAPHSLNKSLSFDFDSYQEFVGSGPAVGYVRVDVSESATYGGIRWEEDLLAIDVRFGFCAVVHGGYTYTKKESADVQQSDPDLDDGYVDAAGPITGNEIIETVEVWRGGKLLKAIEALRLPGPISNGSYSTDPRNRVGINGSNADSQEPIKPQPPLKIGSKFLLTAASYSTGPHSITSLGMNYNMGTGLRKPVLFNQVSGYLDPVQEIIERSEQNGYLLCSVGLI